MIVGKDKNGNYMTESLTFSPIRGEKNLVDVKLVKKTWVNGWPKFRGSSLYVPRVSREYATALEAAFESRAHGRGNVKAVSHTVRNFCNEANREDWAESIRMNIVY